MKGMETTKKKDYVEIRYTGYANGNIFDSNIEEDLKKIDEKAKPKEMIVIIGEGMVASGFDKALENKEIEKEYEITLSAKEAFGERRKELIKTIPLKIFLEKKINPYPGMVVVMDNNLARITAVSGARVITDFNSPLAGKEIKYKFKILRKVSDDKEKSKAALELLLRFAPEFEIKENETIVKGPKILEAYLSSVKDKFKELAGKELKFEEKKEEKKEERQEKKEEKDVKDTEKMPDKIGK